MKLERSKQIKLKNQEAYEVFFFFFWLKGLHLIKRVLSEVTTDGKETKTEVERVRKKIEKPTLARKKHTKFGNGIVKFCRVSLSVYVSFSLVDFFIFPTFSFVVH